MGQIELRWDWRYLKEDLLRRVGHDTTIEA
jgi:hypothetical protein